MDLQRIKDTADCREVAEHLGLDIVYGRAVCPCDEKDAALAIRKKDWRCFRCGAHGSVIDLWMHIRSVDFRTALKDLAAHLGIKETAKPHQYPVCTICVYWVASSCARRMKPDGIECEGLRVATRPGGTE
jgi:DNA primase